MNYQETIKAQERMKEKFINEAVKDWVKGKKLNIPPFLIAVMTEEQIKDAATKKYKKDKEMYIKTSIWPIIYIIGGDKLYNYYMYLRLIDESIDLTNYLNIPYNINIWPKERLLELVKQYGISVLSEIRDYIIKKPPMTFEKYHQKETEKLNKAIDESMNNMRDRSYKKVKSIIYRGLKAKRKEQNQ